MTWRNGPIGGVDEGEATRQQGSVLTTEMHSSAVTRRGLEWGARNGLMPARTESASLPGVCDHVFGWLDAAGHVVLTIEPYPDTWEREKDVLETWAATWGWSVDVRGVDESFWNPGKCVLVVLRGGMLGTFHNGLEN